MNHSNNLQPERIEVMSRSTDEPELGVRAMHCIYPVKIPRSIILHARVDLLSFNMGVGKYTPKLQDFRDRYPNTTILADVLAEEVLEPENMDLSFIRTTRKQDHIFADNLHYDSRYVGYSKQRNIQGSFWRPNQSVEIWRQILNLHNKPRHLQMIDTSIDQLTEGGVDIYRVRPVGQRITGYQTPEEIPLQNLGGSIPISSSQVYTIPAYDGENLHALEFWSSRILHSGITSKDGQMVAVAAKWTDPTDTERKGYYA